MFGFLPGRDIYYNGESCINSLPWNGHNDTLRLSAVIRIESQSLLLPLEEVLRLPTTSNSASDR